jgi:hypothetical protein
MVTLLARTCYAKKKEKIVSICDLRMPRICHATKQMKWILEI